MTPMIYLYLNGEQKGPFTPGQVQAMLASGEALPDTLAWHEGLASWSAVSAVLAPTPTAPQPPMPPLPSKSGLSGWLIALIVIGVLAVLSLPCCCGIALGPITNGIKKAKENAAMQQSRAISLAMAAYADDHNGNYPDAADAPAGGSVVTIGSGAPGAATSTEVFQKLLDGKYVADASLFYIAMPGKVRPVGSRLAADNVCFDVTAGLTASSPGGIPLVFTTGYDVNYAQNGVIMPSASGALSPFTGIAVAYNDHSARFKEFLQSATTIQLMPQGLYMNDHSYRQLKP